MRRVYAVYAKGVDSRVSVNIKATNHADQR